MEKALLCLKFTECNGFFKVAGIAAKLLFNANIIIKISFNLSLFYLPIIPTAPFLNSLFEYVPVLSLPLE